jgi:Ca2+/Na+ antiporter
MGFFAGCVGFTLGVPDTVMGLTFVAAGVSVPDALSSLAVMKEGEWEVVCGVWRVEFDVMCLFVWLF